MFPFPPHFQKKSEAERYDQGVVYLPHFSPLPIARLDVAQSADIVALGDGLGQLQPRVKALADAVVAAHGDIAEPCDLRIAASCLLSCLYKRAVVEVEIQGIVRALHHVHFKDPARSLGEKRLFQPLEALGAAPLHKACALRNAAARDRGRGKIGGALCAPEINDVSCHRRKMRYNQIIAPPEAERTGGLL